MALPPSTSHQKVVEAMQSHYSKVFEVHGATSRGVDWKDEATAQLRYENMASLFRGAEPRPSVLDVGCGYGGFLQSLKASGSDVAFTGLDLCHGAIEKAKQSHPESEWIEGDFLSWTPPSSFDYAVCNGIFTQKLASSHQEMDAYFESVTKKMFSLCRVGIAFNVMTTHSNFQVDNLYYRNPSEMFEYCVRHFSRFVKIDHSYPLYEFTTYVYKSA
jgi:SAM-dependent methyltransferase